ncbi:MULTISPECIES: isoaspartyl peptidase/L-asparaginase [unclassified Flavobacterium]|jgi:beta-aspartyl-peptidase (threonine type)|uniref:isoaspartyl peptidase/L-asparaginase family protein n=1 Tax=unclassified Flavobacterium TaxID=196869 RepID=UPI00106650AE|nr:MULTISPECIES: isoaspartyl peptidase/L-asparaginase [unclassified Flavobacterium]MDQ1166492.1 beta-aspartyl-peptidase (threonine type) [Flavobacterium sp. SORGH_AS_0622]TDX12850.1 beta-aspartyl-peptidase (threonine type) [Flavobacterium sp. S87F.05.LMB.W.Kidney.N]BDU26970.1 L-asparaginase [Flavobacterium sp. GSB-24]
MTNKKTFALCIHGGAGVITPENLSQTDKNKIKNDLILALNAGEAILAEGGNAVDAVSAAVVVLENSIHFNAGKGAVYSREGKHLLEASIMDGATLEAGAVANSMKIKNPILFAKSLLANKDIIMISGEAADSLAEQTNHELVDNHYFDTDFRKEQFLEAKKISETASFLDHTNLKMGTVGAVAIDRNGNIAAATSTGGMTNKLDGRIGDSAIIGAGTYANNKTCGVSCTGVGEYFIRATVSSMVSNLMEFGKMSLEQATEVTIKGHLTKLGGEGGLIAIDKDGNVNFSYNSEGMYRGYVSEKNSEKKVFIWDLEEKI